ncbi:MAG: NAD-binding protein [Proteobacteria bacterium]|nr:potassium channel protein [Desulfocapsa sp.]MBU3943679.1 NAD-binding protein [Pseudomonadota bacterium]MCG2742994.1 NAD-binding protein [Desulfobacteraceae bacterium]MBU4030467.1 NAD-binding protein [Pseudomonadota bacterium]MBU4043859.1 NAD-binding protein [Pseudomonadota bacterium]
MKYIPSQLAFFTRNKKAKRDTFLLLRFFVILLFIITTYSILFHALMQLEGKEFSWITGFYWTLTVMSTLGFGDITFSTDIGLLFSMAVLLTGIVYLLVMLPFTFIQFFYAPWLEAQAKTRTPKELPEDTKNHIILTTLDPITINLIKKLASYNFEYVILVDELQKALELRDAGYEIVLGDYGDPETYTRLRVHQAAMVVATNDDMINTSIAFTIRDVCPDIPIVTNANEDHAFDILNSAGSTHTFQFTKMLGRSLGRRVLGSSMGANILWQRDQLLIAEAPAMRTSLEGKTLAKTRLREKTGVTVVGVWERGHFESAHPQTKISSSTVLVLAGSAEQLEKFNKLFSFSCSSFSSDSKALILGGGRVGNAAAEALEEQNIPYNIVEKNRVLTKNRGNSIYGNAADFDTLHKAGIMNARSVLITTHNDDMNVYLTIFCRQLRPDVQIISRANNERTVSKLHRAGADLVMSYASMAANSIINLINQEQLLMLVEGLSIFRASAQNSLAGKSLSENHLREETGCSVVAITREGKLILNPDPFSPLELNDELLLIGTADAEKQFKERYGSSIT